LIFDWKSRVTTLPAVNHHPKLHAAARTGEYLYCQLIPYIGNKRKLLPLIAEALAQTGVSRGTFVDLFTGSTVVARLAKSGGLRVVANDWEPYSHAIAQATVASNRVPEFRKLGGAERVLAALNELPGVEGYVAQHLCPADDARPDPDRERMFFTRANGMRIDAVRERITEWDTRALLGEAERAYLLSALVYAVSYVSNTSGLFKGFHRGWGGKTGTALYRILSPLTLRPPAVIDNGQPNLALRRDARELVGELRTLCGELPGVVYLDPPYNQHPYGSNYHVLNTVVLWDKPPLRPETRIDGKCVNKSAIRTDWRTERRSAYNSAQQAPAALAELVGAIDARWILMSYSTDGNIPVERVLATLASRGRLTVTMRRYKRYRVSTPRMSRRPHNIEFVAAVDTSKRARSSDVTGCAEQIEAAREALTPMPP
jgi:adenine-specific DNA-methyltransferase